MESRCFAELCTVSIQICPGFSTTLRHRRLHQNDKIKLTSTHPAHLSTSPKTFPLALVPASLARCLHPESQEGSTTAPPPHAHPALHRSALAATLFDRADMCDSRGCSHVYNAPNTCDRKCVYTQHCSGFVRRIFLRRKVSLYALTFVMGRRMERGRLDTPCLRRLLVLRVWCLLRGSL